MGKEMSEGYAVMIVKDKDVKAEQALARLAKQSGAAVEPGGPTFT